MGYNAWRVFLSRRQRRAQWSANAARRFPCQYPNAARPPRVLCSRARHGASQSLCIADFGCSVRGWGSFCRYNSCFCTPCSPRDWWWNSSASITALTSAWNLPGNTEFPCSISLKNPAASRLLIPSIQSLRRAIRLTARMLNGSAICLCAA